MSSLAPFLKWLSCEKLLWEEISTGWWVLVHVIAEKGLLLMANRRNKSLDAIKTN